MLHSSCLCGEVSWDIAGPPQFLSHCHCSRCRKGHGSPFATYLTVADKTLHLKGRESVQLWESSPGYVRSFCRTCGSKTPGEAYQGMQFVAAGNLEEDPGLRPQAHIFVASKASWYDIPDQMPRFEAYPDDFDAPVLADRKPLDRAGHGLRGGCACQAVTFRLIEAPVRAYNCHCGRCRKARSAAYAANLFVPGGSVLFTRGQEHVTAFKVPSADRFTQAFCNRCGSPMPWTYRERGITVVPMGSLDDDPGIRPQSHIFVGSKAPWFDIHDELPRFESHPS